jgi:hypothetical protein
MSKWNELLGEIGINGRVENPYWDKTKGEMSSECANTDILKEIVPFALSCAHPTYARYLGQKGRGVEHCGYCLPCLIRRAALDAAWGPGHDQTVYTVPDLRAQSLNTRTETGKQVRSFQVAIERLRRRPDLAKMLIHKPGPLTDESMRLDQLADVYRRGLIEVAHLIRGVTTIPS